MNIQPTEAQSKFVEIAANMTIENAQFEGGRKTGKTTAVILFINAAAEAGTKKILSLGQWYQAENFQVHCKEILPGLGWDFRKGTKTWSKGEAKLVIRFLESEYQLKFYQRHNYDLLVLDDADEIKYSIKQAIIGICRPKRIVTTVTEQLTVVVRAGDQMVGGSHE